MIVLIEKILISHQFEEFYPAGPGVGEVFIFELQHERHPGGGGGGAGGVTASLNRC